MIVVRLQGGLGNQLFQYAFGKSISKKFKKKLFLDKSKYSSKTEKREFHLEKFRLKYDGYYNGYSNKYLFEITKLLNFVFFKNFKFYEEKFFHFDNEIFNLDYKNKNYFFNGYWQSYKYFIDYLPEIRSELNLVNYLNISKNLFKEISSDSSVCLHVRGGDYRTEPFLSFNGLLDHNYYNIAVNKLKQNVEIKKIFIFTDDIEYLEIISKNFNFDFQTISFHNTKTAIEDFAILSLSKNIIISNSTFAWWASMLTDKARIIFPNKWFNIRYNDTKDLFPDFWHEA